MSAPVMKRTFSNLEGEIPFYPPEVDETEQKNLLDVLDSNYLNDGPITRNFEQKIASFIGTKYAIGVTSCTAALSLSLMACGIGPGDEVIVPDITFIATANAVRMTGANVRLVDVEPKHFSLDPEKLEKAISLRTKAVIPVEVNGRAPDYKRIQQICDKFKLTLICDSAESLGSTYLNKKLGGYGKASCFSFSANKRITTGQGGMIVTNDPDMETKLRQLKDQGRAKQGTGGDDSHPVLGFNFKLTNVQSAIGIGQMDKLMRRVQQAKDLYETYVNELGNLKALRIPDLGDPETILQWFDIMVEDKKRLCDHLDNVRIAHRSFWHPLHTQPPYASTDDTFPNAIEVSKLGMWLPSGVQMTKDDAKRVSDQVKKAFA